MVGMWLYPISAEANRFFDLDSSGESIRVTVESFQSLVEDGRIVEDRRWYITQNWKRVEPGDEVFIYTGDGDRGIIGYAKVAEVEHGADGWFLRPEFDLVRSRQLLSNPIPAAVVRELVLPRRAVTALQHVWEFLEPYLPWYLTDFVPTFPEEVAKSPGLIEGAAHKVWVNAYERNPKARRECVKIHGVDCCICGFNFEAVYGEVAKGFIHVHHLRSLADIGEEYVVDPENDLRPVCPNCHAVLHLGGKSRSIEDVTQLMQPKAT